MPICDYYIYNHKAIKMQLNTNKDIKEKKATI